MKISPSRLTYVSKCPFYKPTPFTNTAAQEGIDLHYQMELLVQRHWSEWNDYISSLKLSDESKSLVETAADKLLPLVSLLPEYKFHPDYTLTKGAASLDIGVYPELQIETSRGKFGYIDLLINHGDRMTIVDYKFVRAQGDFELQLAAYALYLRNDLSSPPEIIESQIIAPHLSDEELGQCAWQYTDEVLSRYEYLIQGIEDSVGDPNKPANPGPHCQYCSWNGRCAKQANTVAAVALPQSARYTPAIMNAETLEDRAIRRDLMKFMETMAESIKEDDKKFFAEHPEITALPGYKMTRCAGRFSLDKTRAAELNRELLSRFASLTPSQLLDMALPDQKQLAEAVAISEGISESRAEELVKDAFSMFMSRGTPYVMLKKAGSEMRVPEAAVETVDPVEFLMN